MAGTNNVNLGTGSGGVGICYADLTVTASLDQQAAAIYDCEMFNANSPAQIQSLSLSSGNNTINSTNCPALPQCGGCIIIPPANNTIALTLKGASGDTGIALSLVAPTFLAFNTTPPTSFVINSANTLTILLGWV